MNNDLTSDYYITNANESYVFDKSSWSSYFTKVDESTESNFSKTTYLATSTHTINISPSFNLSKNFTFSDLPIKDLLQILSSSNYTKNNCLTNCSNAGKCQLVNTSLICLCFDSKNRNSKCKQTETSSKLCLTRSCRLNQTCFELTKNSEKCLYETDSYFDEKIKACQNETCSNHGTCYYKDKKIYCECFFMYKGDKCEYEANEKKTVENIVQITTIIAIICICLFILYIVILDLISFLKHGLIRKKKTKNKYKRKIIKFYYKP